MKLTINYLTTKSVECTITEIKYCKERDVVIFITEEGFIQIQRTIDAAIFLKNYYPEALKRIIKIRKSL